MAAKKKVVVKKKSGTRSDSTTVAVKTPSLVGGKKKTDNSTSYGKTNTYKKQPVPNYPYGGTPLVVKKTTVAVKKKK